MDGLILILIGCFNIYLTRKLIKNPQFVENYTKTSPKAFIWRKIFGEEKAIKIIKTVLAPIGLFLGICVVLIGIILLLT
jgi:hypothetical protein